MAKVRIIATREIMDFAPGSSVVVHRPGSDGTEVYRIEDVEVIPDNLYNETAVAAMQSLLLRGVNSDEWIAKRAYEIADAMMKGMPR